MGTLTITTTGAQDTRIIAALGKRLGLAGNANAAQVKAWTIEQIKQMVYEEERAAARIAAEAGITEITPT